MVTSSESARRRQAELGSDLAVAAAVGDEPEYLEFACAQAGIEGLGSHHPRGNSSGGATTTSSARTASVAAVVIYSAQLTSEDLAFKTFLTELSPSDLTNAAMEFEEALLHVRPLTCPVADTQPTRGWRSISVSRGQRKLGHLLGTHSDFRDDTDGVSPKGPPCANSAFPQVTPGFPRQGSGDIQRVQSDATAPSRR
jgi:hypothetical protein